MADEAHEQIHIGAPVDVCFDLATDFEGYPAWASDVKHVKVVERDDAGPGHAGRFPGGGVGPQRALRPRLRPRRCAPARSRGSWSRATCCVRSAGSYTFDDVDGGTDVDLRPHRRPRDPVARPGEAPRRGTHRRRRAQGPQAGGRGARDGRRHRPGRRAGRGRRPRAPSIRSITVDPDADADVTDGADDSDWHRGRRRGRHADRARTTTTSASEARSLPLPSAIEVVVSELLGAVPEVRDHLLAAADELLDAAKAVLDAADRVVRQQREGSS